MDTLDENFEAAFAEASGAEPADQAPADPQDNTEGAFLAATNDDPQQEPAAEAPPQDQAEPVATPDIWAEAPEPLKAAYEAAEQKAREAEHKLRSKEGREAAYQRELHTLRRQVKEVTGSVAEAEDPLTFLESDEWKKLKVDYEGDLGPVFNVMERMAARLRDTDSRFAQMEEAQTVEVLNANAELFEEQAPDWRDVVGNDQFASWIETQPMHIREAFERNREHVTDPAEAVDVVNRARAHFAINATPAPTPTDPMRDRRLEAARTATAKSPQAGDPANSFEAFFEQAAAKAKR